MGFMSRKSIGRQRGYQHKDFSDLLSELKDKDSCGILIGVADAIVKESTNVNAPVLAESKKRHRIMSDQKIKYLDSKKSNVIHDKHCSCTKDIADEDLGWSEEYRIDLKPCSECKLQAYVASGAKDPKDIELYLHFFEKVRMTDTQVKNIFIDNKMKTRITSDSLTVWHIEDTWRIKALPKKGQVQLLHNNYVKRKNGIREFVQGFHIQNDACADTNVRYALSVIKKYEYNPEEWVLHSTGTNSKGCLDIIENERRSKKNFICPKLLNEHRKI